MAGRLEMFVRRGIVVMAVALSLGMAWIIRTRLAANESTRNASFFDDASAIYGAFRKAVGPHPPVVELVIESDTSTARIVVGKAATQYFTFSRESGFVTGGPQDAFPERDDIAFSLSTVPFDAVPGIVQEGARSLGGPPERLVVDRLPGAAKLRFRVMGNDGETREVTLPAP